MTASAPESGMGAEAAIASSSVQTPPVRTSMRLGRKAYSMPPPAIVV